MLTKKVIAPSNTQRETTRAATAIREGETKTLVGSCIGQISFHQKHTRLLRIFPFLFYQAIFGPNLKCYGG